jgi:hypothetical protein
MPGNAKPVTLPAAAGHMSDQAVDHLPADHFVFTPTTTASLGSQPIDHVPPQAEGHVPSEVPPPVTLPEAALHMSDTASTHLPGHIDFLL